MSSPDVYESVAGLSPLTEDEVDQNYGYRERYESDGGDESFADFREAKLPPQIEALTNDDLARLISQKAHDLLTFYEVGGLSGYQKRYKSPCWPGLTSGITIGIGYDLGYNSLANFERDWKPYLSATDFELLSRTVSRRGETAKAMLGAVRHIVVPWEAAIAVYHATTVPKFAKLVLATFPNVRELHAHAFGALFSLVYNRGARLKGERRQHMRNIRDHASAKQFQSVPGEFRSMKVIWSKEKFSGLHKRRDAEARLFEDGLLEAQKAMIVTLPPQPVRDLATGFGDTSATAGFAGVAGLAGTQSGATAGAQAESFASRLSPFVSLESLESASSAEGEYEGEPPDVTDDMVPPPPPFRELESAQPWTAVTWVKDDDLSTEYRHIRAEDRELKDCTFQFTTQDLDLLIRANGFEPDRTHGRIIFGLRGARLEATTGNPKDKSFQIERASLLLRETRPDHAEFKCVIGVYHIASQRLSGFIASTVPKRAAVLAASKTNGKGCNLLPCGCYSYVVGPHRTKSGCLREAEPFTVLRTSANVVYDSRDAWDYTPQPLDKWPYDNIHPAFMDRTYSAKFSSNGCQVIEGSINTLSGEHTGVWALFRKALGLTKPGTGDHGLKFSYVLLTGLEAAIAARLRETGADTDFAAVLARLGRLRHGSRGETVVRLQRVLGLPETGIFDAAMRKALTDYQKGPAALGWADGIYGPELDQKLAHNVFGAEQPPIVVANVPFLAGQLESARDPYESLYFEIGRRSAISRTNPGLASAPNLPQLESITPESFFDFANMGRRVFTRIERAAHDLICGDQTTDAKDRSEIQKTLLDAAKISPEEVVKKLTEILVWSLGILGPIAPIVAKIIVDKVLKPAVQDKQEEVATMIQGACTAWARELNKRAVLAGLDPAAPYSGAAGQPAPTSLA